MNEGLKKIAIGLLLTALSMLAGVCGFMIIEGYSMLEAIYMTVITLSTVGFKEVRPLSEGGMIFTSIYILLNIGLFAYIVSRLVGYVFEGELQSQFLQYFNEKDLKKMKDHVIVCGFGRNGERACIELKAQHTPCIVIDKNPNIFEEANKVADQILIGDASDEDLILRSGIERARAIILALPNDADNVFVTLTIREINEEIRIISRASNEYTARKLYKAGADYVVQPYELGGKHMAQIITKPAVIHFLDMLEGVESDFQMEEILFDQLKSKFRGKSIKELNIRSQTGVTVVAYQKSDGEISVNPNADVGLAEGDTMIILGTLEAINGFKKYYT